MKKNLFPPSAVILAILLCALTLISNLARAQSIPTLPCCIDFDNPNPGGISGSAVRQLEVRYPGFSGLPGDGYLHALDGSGASWARLRNPNNGTPSCFGDWKGAIKPGKCLELCWDVQLLTDGDNSQVIAKPARIVIWSGGQSATFVTSTDITEQGGPNNGWYSFCAPITLSNPDGTLPSNDQGQWILPNDANGNPLPASVWDEMLCNIDQIAFFVDYHSNQSEEWCWDNICLRETDCDDCMIVSKGTWDCDVDSTGNRTLKYSFDVTNLSGKTANVGLVPDSLGLNIEPNTWNFDPDLAHGETATVTLCFDGAIPGSIACFEFVLFNLQDGECCRTEICVKVPCVKIDDEQIDCIAGASGAVYNFTLTNISGAPAEYAYLLSKDPGVTFSPSMIPLTGLADGASLNVGPITVNGATPGAELCFCVVILDEQLRECCITEHCLRMPDCNYEPAEPSDNGIQTKPCEPNSADPNLMIVMSPDGCFSLCDEEIICDPLNPGCYTYNFTVTNHSSAIMDHILFPNPNITPASVIFPDPLDPGEAARVSIKITGASPGSFAVPMVLVSLDNCSCCHFHHVIELEGCDCLVVLREELECEGIDPQTGLYCYSYSATIQNLTGETIEHVFLIDDSGSGISFDPDHFPTGGLPHLAVFNFVTTVKIPAGTPSIHFHISLHNANFEQCCAVERWMRVPDCCDCDEMITFEFDPVNPASFELPEGLTLINLDRDPQTGKLGFGDTISPFPFVYMAASGRSTMVRIDINTGTVLGEYRTAPQPIGATNPSRTTVDRFGECWVGNRRGTFGNQGSVMRVGVVLGGTRGDRLGSGPYTFSPNPAGEYLQGPFTYVSPSVIDRDGDGFIRTSAGLGSILDWDPSASGLNSAGGVNLADDECIVNFVRVTETVVRALAIDSNNDLWAGGTDTSIYQRIDGSSGAVTGTATIPGGYGALIDANDALWSVDAAHNWVYRHDLNTNTGTTIPSPGAYGIGINPCDGSVWVSSVFYSSEPAFGLINQFVLRKFNPSGALIDACAQPGQAQGLCVDQSGDVWVSEIYYSGGAIWRFDNSCTLIATVSAGLAGSTGCAVDSNGKIWASDLISSSAVRIDPAGSVVDLTSPLGAGAQPYNYSDMTGFVALGAAGQTGIMQYTHDSLCPNTDWGRLTWASVGEVPRRCGIRAEVRASNDPLNFPSMWTPVYNGASFCGGIQGSAPITGQYIQIRFIFERANACDPQCDPRLCWFKIECCDVFGVGPADNPPVIEIDTPIVSIDGSLNPITIGANVLDPEGRTLVATWSSEGQTIAINRINGFGNSEVTLDFLDGITELTLTVSDGPNTAVASTSVMIGDHLPPVIHCQAKNLTDGDIRIKAFSTMIPDFTDSFTASDNVTPASRLAIQQTPAPGTVVGQGTHLVTLSVGDDAGNVGHCNLFIIVEPVISLSGFPNYSVIDLGDPIPFSLNLDVPSSEIVRTTIYVDGEPYLQVNGPLLQPINLDLPVGAHSVHATVEDSRGFVSTSGARAIRIADPDPNGFAPDQTLTAAWQDASHSVLLLSFGTPDGLECQLQQNSDLANEWRTIHTVIGNGGRIEFPFELPTDNPTLKRTYFRVLYNNR